MKTKLVLWMFMLCLVAPHALVQTDKAMGTVTDDETQARLRISNCVFGSPNVDMYVDGEVAVNAGVPQANIEPLFAAMLGHQVIWYLTLLLSTSQPGWRSSPQGARR